jgi:hypothetical protein
MRLNEVEGEERYRVEISNRFAALENLDTEVDVNKAGENIGENFKISSKENLDAPSHTRRKYLHGVCIDFIYLFEYKTSHTFLMITSWCKIFHKKRKVTKSLLPQAIQIAHQAPK